MRRWGRSLATLALGGCLLLGAMFFAGCFGRGQGKPKSLSSRMVAVRDVPDSDIAIVFVHGLGGDPVGTWTNAETKAYWPDLVANDPIFRRCNVYAYEYRTGFVGTLPAIDQVGDDLRARLTDVSNPIRAKNLVFVAHSLGGLVVRACLLRHRGELATRAKMAFFLGTPTDGSNMANLAKALSGNAQIAMMANESSYDYLSQIKRDWLAAKLPISSYMAYEIQPTNGVFVVDDDSATALSDTEVVGIDANHVGMAKPAGVEDLAHITLRNAFDEAVPPGLCSRPYPDGSAKDELQRRGYAAATILAGSREGLKDSDFSIVNHAGLDTCLAIYDCTAAYPESKLGPGDATWACRTVSAFEQIDGNLYLEFRKPSGWFLFVYRFYDDKTGGARDVILGVFDVFRPEHRRLMLVNDESRDGGIALEPAVEPKADANQQPTGESS